MDESQQQTVLKSIAVSTSSTAVAPQDRQLAFQVLEQFKAYEGRIPACIVWLHQERHVWQNVDITIATKLYVLSILEKFLQKGYAGLAEADRLALRHAVLTAARQLAPLSSCNENRILGNKLASLLAGLMVRDFPQRWTTFFQDVFVPIRMGGLWYDGEENVHSMGVLICLECLKLVTEDCTDSDYNAKISTSRRSDVLIGLNEVSSQFMPLLFAILEHISVLVQSKNMLHNMRTFLISNGRTLSQMTSEEATMYKQELERKEKSSRLISECLVTLERFCFSMPLDWILGREEFVAAFLHLLREPTGGIQIQAAACVEKLANRKLEPKTWRQLISQLPQSIGEANAVAQTDVDESRVEAAVNGTAGETPDALTMQLEFHKGLARMLSVMISAHLANITTDKEIMSGRGPKFQSVSAFLRLLVDMLHHPSGRIAGEQINMWIALLRDPHNAKSGILTPFAQELLTCYMDHLVRIRWEDVEEETHPQSSILAASWDDEDEYELWMTHLRSKASQLFKFLGHVEPGIVSSALNSRIQGILAQYGNGQPGDHLDPSNNQLTQQSDACFQFEALHQPVEYVLNGVPSWAVEDDKEQKRKDSKREMTRAQVRNDLAQLANAIVSWSPNYLWLKFWRAAILDSLKSYWNFEPSTLLPAIESLFGYMSGPDEWRSSPSPSNGQEQGISTETTGLRKKSGVALVSISKKVPQHLVPWLSQLSNATNSLLSSNKLLPMSEMHMYEFLSCVATAVEEPAARTNFVANVLASSLNTLESPEVTQSISSVDSLLASIGVTNESNLQERVTDPENVKAVTDRYCRMFSSVNQLLSVGKRCHEAARKRYKNFIPLQDLSIPVAELHASHFPDEGPVSIQELSLNDPFAPLARRILPIVTQILDVTLGIWHPDCQAMLLPNSIQRYALAISDDEAYLSQKHDSKNGGVFGEGGTAGSVVAGVDRRATNLVPRWSGWLNELRNTCFQLLGMFAGERVLYAPEVAGFFPKFVSVVADPVHLRAMEHRHFNQFLKQFIEILMLSCPVTLYTSHLGPIIGPVFEQMKLRMQLTWSPITNPTAAPSIPDLGKALTSSACNAAAALASRGGDEWYASYYARAGIFVGELNSVTAESVVEKYRIELTRTYGDTLQIVLALKGDWALVLATQAKEEQAAKRNDSSKLATGPRNHIAGKAGPVNADGTPRSDSRIAVDARKSLRITALCHFLFLENEGIAGSITLTVIQCLEIPDAYTSRRCTRICHRILETVAWSTRYTPILANQMFLVAVKNIVTEPKWMVGLEWDMINLLRDVYCRLVLGQVLQPGGQGPGVQQLKDPLNPTQFEQAKTVDRPLQGGGILVAPSSVPRQILASLPGLDEVALRDLEDKMNEKRSAKDQKDVLRDFLRIAAENSAQQEGGIGIGIFDRAIKEESLLNQKIGKATVQDIPEKLVTQSMINRRNKKEEEPPHGLGAFQLFS